MERLLLFQNKMFRGATLIQVDGSLLKLKDGQRFLVRPSFRDMATRWRIGALIYYTPIDWGEAAGFRLWNGETGETLEAWPVD